MERPLFSNHSTERIGGNAIVRLRFSMSMNREATSGNFLDILKMHQAARGDIYLVLFPELFKPSGLHLSLHASGKWLIGTEKPHFNVPLPDAEWLGKHFQENAIGMLEAMVKPPKPGYPAIILILPHPERFVTAPIRNRYIMDLPAAFDASTIVAIDNTANLAHALLQLRTGGYIDDDATVTIMSLESGEISIYHPMNVAHETGTEVSLPWQRELRKYQGVITTFEAPSGGNLPRYLETTLFKPLVKPMEELVESLSTSKLSIGCSAKMKQFERHFEELGKGIQRKESLHLS